MKITKCRICNSNRIDECIDLGMQPWCNDFIKLDQLGMKISLKVSLLPKLYNITSKLYCPKRNNV